MAVCNVYWVRQAEHTDIFSQGYVGITNNFTKRMEGHKNRPQNGHFRNVINKYGWDNLVKEVVVIAEEDYCLDVETKLRPEKGIGWNIAIGGGKPPVTRWNLGKTMSDETKAKVSASRKGITSWNKGVPLSDETKEKLKVSLKGRKTWNKGLETSDEVKEKQRQAKLGTIGNRKGKKNSPEHREKIKATKALNPRIWTEEERKQISLRNTGIVYPRASCLYCRFEGGVTGMARWHFDKCRNKGELNWQQ
jgi:group I intron endonuclease